MPHDNELRVPGESVEAFAETLTEGLGKVKRRFVVDAIEGIRRSRSLNLKHMAWALDENVRIHATEKRLSRHLADARLADVVSQRLLERAAEFVGRHTLLVITTYTLAKKYSSTMRLLDSEQVLPVDEGFQVCDIIATDRSIGRCVPVYSKIWSCNAREYVSDEEEVLKAVRTVARSTGGDGMFYGNALVGCCLPGERVMSMNLVSDDAEVECDHRPISVSNLRRRCGKPYGSRVYRYDREANVEEVLFLHYGVVPIHLPEVSRRLSLLAIESDKLNGAFLIANGMRHRREEIFNTVYSWLEGMEAEKAFHEYKDRFDLTSFRVLTYERLQFLMTLLHAASFYELAVVREGLAFEPTIRFRPHAGHHQRNYVIPEERIPRFRHLRPTPWHY